MKYLSLYTAAMMVILGLNELKFLKTEHEQVCERMRLCHSR